MSDYVPRTDPEFNLWQSSLNTIVQTNVTVWGILPADVTALIASATLYGTMHLPKQAILRTVPKPIRRQRTMPAGVYEKNLAQFHRAMALAQRQSDRQRPYLHEHYGESNTRTSVGVPATFPVGTIDFSVRNQHTISYSDSATPTSKAKPSGVHGHEIWRKVGTETTFVYVVTCTAAIHRHLRRGRGGQDRYLPPPLGKHQRRARPWGASVSALIVG